METVIIVVLQDQVKSNRYTLIEYWESQDTLNNHQKTDHWQHLDKTVSDYLVTDTYEEHHYQEIN